MLNQDFGFYHLASSETIHNGHKVDKSLILYGMKSDDGKVYNPKNVIHLIRTISLPFIEVIVYNNNKALLGRNFVPRDSPENDILESERSLEVELLNSFVENGCKPMPSSVCQRIKQTFAVDYSYLQRYVSDFLPPPSVD